MTSVENQSLQTEIEEFLKERGAIRVGFATLETLGGDDAPRGADIQYRLPEAKSAISYATAFDKDIIQEYLAKSSPDSFFKHEEDRFALNYGSAQLSKELAEWLDSKGYTSKRVLPNNNYRKDIRDWRISMPPTVSLRFMAIVSGVAMVGYSGNLGIKGYGAGIHLGGVVTTAELEPTEQLAPDSELNFCNKCKSCFRSCTSEMFSGEETQQTKIGKYTYEFGKRIDYGRCQYVCGGFTGLHKSREWSTWSPGRFPSPVDMEPNEVLGTMGRVLSQYSRWPERKASGEYTGYVNEAVPGINIRLTCGLCQVVCSGVPQQTAKNYLTLKNSGCVLQKPDGDIIIAPPKKAQEIFDGFPPKHKRLYELRQRNRKRS